MELRLGATEPKSGKTGRRGDERNPFPLALRPFSPL